MISSWMSLVSLLSCLEVRTCSILPLFHGDVENGNRVWVAYSSGCFSCSSSTLLISQFLYLIKQFGRGEFLQKSKIFICWQVRGKFRPVSCSSREILICVYLPIGALSKDLMGFQCNIMLCDQFMKSNWYSLSFLLTKSDSNVVYTCSFGCLFFFIT